MRRFALPVLLIAAGAAAAHAETGPSVTEGARIREVAVAVNTPLIWKYSFAASGWMGVKDHHAIRVNFARYQYPVWAFLAAIYADDGPSDADFGHTTDLGVGWVYYPRRVLDGATLEAGVLARVRRVRDHIADDNVASEERFTSTYGGRVLAGWTWRLSDLFFFSIGAGVSVGYERGREKRILGYDAAGEMTVQQHVSRPDVAAEGYLRIGATFGR